MKIYTKTGDKGTTALIGGIRVSKSALRIEAYGAIDELNSYIGLLRDQEVNRSRQALLKEIQDRLFTIGAHLALAPEKSSSRIPDLLGDDVTLLEAAIDAMDSGLAPLLKFILPGGHPSISFGHVARTVCRRAERMVIRLHEEQPVTELIIRYLNRLSDYLFILCRMMGKELQVEEITWTPRR